MLQSGQKKFSQTDMIVLVRWLDANKRQLEINRSTPEEALRLATTALKTYIPASTFRKTVTSMGIELRKPKRVYIARTNKEMYADIRDLLNILYKMFPQIKEPEFHALRDKYNQPVVDDSDK